MVKTISYQKSVPFLVPIVIIILMIAISKTTLFHSNSSALSNAITIDLLLTSPIVYLLLIRKKAIPNITVVSVFVVGLIVASFIVPKENHHLLDLAQTWVLPVAEFAVVGFILLKVKQTIQSFRKESTVSPDFYTALKKACKEVLPKKVDVVLAMEIAVFYYSFFAWKKKKLQSNEFSYHRENSIIVLLAVILFVLLIETFVVHILVESWSSTAAWILTLLSLYTGLQIFAVMKSMSRRPIVISEESLLLKYGLCAETDIPYSAIESVELSAKPIEFNKNTRHMSPLKDADSYNVILALKERQAIYGLYGVKRSFGKLAFHVDDKEKFYDLLVSKLS